VIVRCPDDGIAGTLGASANATQVKEERMTRLQEISSSRHVILPVIHVSSLYQAAHNTELARAAGADGVFLINHSMSATQLLSIHERVRRKHEGFWIGVNCLGVTANKVFELVSLDVAGVWTDNAGIREDEEEQPYAEQVVKARTRAQWQGIYFGGVAFKYQRHVNDLARAAQVAADYMDVVATSGPGTGQSADIAKIRTMKEALGDFPLAIASGITPENVAEYLPVADCFLVATGISRSFEELDPTRTQALVDAVRTWRG